MSKEVHVDRIILEVNNIKGILNRVLAKELSVSDEAVRECLAGKPAHELQNGSVQMVNHTNTLVATVDAVMQIVR